MFRLLYIVCFLFISFSSHAAIYSRIDSTSDTSGCEPTGGCTTVNYHYTISAWDDDDSTPNPCYNQNFCQVYIQHRHKLDGEGGNGTETRFSLVDSNNYSCITSSRDMGALAKCYKSAGKVSFPYSGVTGHKGDALSSECVGIFYNTMTTWDSVFGELLPGSVCGVAPPPAGVCKTVNIVDIDHGSLPANEIDGHQESTTLTIDCNAGMSGKIYMDTDVITLSKEKGLTSLLSLNGESLGTKGINVSLMTGVNNLPVMSVLKTTQTIPAGEYSGSAILILALP